ncbi:hypothetical protein DE146DRAFT_783088 [Phaeosphaeria sp. MPI-PUGE-AT-0046c]|nr:hypothetical protein DE146DRAFT_783088 [Phaeosphaeria sp. MPI-PUGE-AT-0046c]
MPPSWMLQELEDRTERRDEQARRPSTAPRCVASLCHVTRPASGQNAVPVPRRGRDDEDQVTHTTPSPRAIGAHGMGQDTATFESQNIVTTAGHNTTATSARPTMFTTGSLTTQTTYFQRQTQSQHRKVDSGVTVGLPAICCTLNSSDNTNVGGKTSCGYRDHTFETFVNQEQSISNNVQQEPAGRWRSMWRKMRMRVQRKREEKKADVCEEEGRDEEQIRLLGRRWS